MPQHRETRRVAYSPGQMYDLVADVARYPEFLPWVTGIRVRKESDTEVVADMLVGFMQLRESFTSLVHKTPKSEIKVDYVDGPLRDLCTNWQFADDGQGGCLIDFEVRFSFKNRMFEVLAGQFFERALVKMIGAFEKRAADLYDSSKADDSGSSSSSAHNAA